MALTFLSLTLRGEERGGCTEATDLSPWKWELITWKVLGNEKQDLNRRKRRKAGHIQRPSFPLSVYFLGVQLPKCVLGVQRHSQWFSGNCERGSPFTSCNQWGFISVFMRVAYRIGVWD